MSVSEAALSKGRPLSSFRKGTTVKGGGHMGLIRNYQYVLEADPGTSFATGFKPVFSPGEMLALGVFEGKYLNDCTDEFPREWFLMADALGTLSPSKHDLNCNYFKVGSRQPLSVWKEKGWSPVKGRHTTGSGRAMLADAVRNPDERGWFQWYCRYWIGRRLPELDAVQIGRWRSFTRHAGAIKHRCKPGDLECSKRERQALLQWSYDPFI